MLYRFILFNFFIKVFFIASFLISRKLSFNYICADFLENKSLTILVSNYNSFDGSKRVFKKSIDYFVINYLRIFKISSSIKNSQEKNVVYYKHCFISVSFIKDFKFSKQLIELIN